MHIREIRRWMCILWMCLLVAACGSRVEPEKIVLQRLSWYPGATALTTTTTAEYVLVQFNTTDTLATIREHYRAKLPGFRLDEGNYERSVDVYGDFQFGYAEGRESQVIVVDVEPAGSQQQTVKVYIYERTWR